jgi:putative flippase GtrA
MCDLNDFMVSVSMSNLLNFILLGALNFILNYFSFGLFLKILEMLLDVKSTIGAIFVYL